MCRPRDSLDSPCCVVMRLVTTSHKAPYAPPNSLSCLCLPACMHACTEAKSCCPALLWPLPAHAVGVQRRFQSVDFLLSGVIFTCASILSDPIDSSSAGCVTWCALRLSKCTEYDLCCSLPRRMVPSRARSTSLLLRQSGKAWQTCLKGLPMPTGKSS